MSGDFCPTEQVTLQENGIVRNAQGTIIGRLVVDVDEMCNRHNKIGYKQGYRAGTKDEREACAKVCDGIAERANGSHNAMADDRNDEPILYLTGKELGACNCAEAIRARGQQ